MKTTYLIFLLLFSFINRAKAQLIGGGVGADSVKTSIYPNLGYLNDEGFIIGAFYNRKDYSGKDKPFNYSLKAKATVSTRGYLKIGGRFEKTRTFGSKIGSIFNAHLHRYKAENFFGIGNDIPFSNKRYKNEYYYFQSLNISMMYDAKLPLYKGKGGALDLLAGIGSEYFIPHVRQQNSSFARNMPPGSAGGWVQSLHAGISYDRRENDYDPHHGNRAEFNLRYSPELLSDYAMTRANLDIRQYFYIFNYLTIANKLDVNYAGGDVPFWEMPTLGNRQTLRGYPRNRFKGNASVSYTLEMRAWLLEFPKFFNFRIGGQLFTDVGRVFTPENSAGDLLKDYHQTVGVGAAFSVIKPGFILVGAWGFSEDISRFYFGFGYLF